MVTKSGLMVGLGETEDELLEVFRNMRAHNIDVLTVGQYLRPSKKHAEVVRYYRPEEFTRLKDQALAMGFGHVEAGPPGRSPYHADEQIPPPRKSPLAGERLVSPSPGPPRPVCAGAVRRGRRGQP